MNGFNRRMEGREEIKCIYQGEQENSYNPNNKDKHLITGCNIIIVSPTAPTQPASLVLRGRFETNMATNEKHIHTGLKV